MSSGLKHLPLGAQRHSGRTVHSLLVLLLHSLDKVILGLEGSVGFGRSLTNARSHKLKGMRLLWRVGPWLGSSWFLGGTPSSLLSHGRLGRTLMGWRHKLERMRLLWGVGPWWSWGRLLGGAGLSCLSFIRNGLTLTGDTLLSLSLTTPFLSVNTTVSSSLTILAEVSSLRLMINDKAISKIQTQMLREVLFRDQFDVVQNRLL